MATKAIISLIQQSQRLLDSISPQLKEEASKKIAEIPQQIPTESNIKQIMMDEITSRDPELACSIEMKNRLDSTYNKSKSKIKKLQDKVNESEKKLSNIQNQLTQSSGLLDNTNNIIRINKSLIPSLRTIIIVAKISLRFLRGPYANGAAEIALHKLIEKTEGKIQEFKSGDKIFTKRINKMKNKINPLQTTLNKSKTTTKLIKSKTQSSLGLIESYYLNHILMCDVDGTSIKDEDYVNAVNEAEEKANNLSTKITIQAYGLFLIENDLLPNTIQRIRNANFEVIQYRIA